MLNVKNTRIIVRNHYSQFDSREGALSRCKINPSWAIMGHHGLFLTTDYNIWFLDDRYSDVFYGQFSKVQSGKMGPAPGRFELSKGISN